MTLEQLEAVRRLCAIAQGDTGQSRRVADFLLAWHNAAENGGWDPSDLWAVDLPIATDMVTVVGALPRAGGQYPGDVGFQAEIERIWQQWRAPRRRRRRP